MSEKTESPSSAATRPVITPVDRLVLTLCLAIITHAVVVLGITFTQQDRSPPRYDAMEIILVQQKSDPPDDASVLAQASLQGGGDSEENIMPATPLPAPFPDNVAELATPPPTDVPVTVPESDPGNNVIAVESDQGDVLSSVENVNEQEPEDQEPVETARREKPLPKASTLISNSMKMAALSAEIQRKLEARAERPRQKFISASTSEFKYAAYMEAWRAKVERIGNLNYPDAARRQGLSGSLILEVALKPDGSIHEINIGRSSGHKVLDDAAIRIVHLAAPYSPFPDNIRDETDVLRITRTWQFLDNAGFR